MTHHLPTMTHALAGHALAVDRRRGWLWRLALGLLLPLVLLATAPAVSEARSGDRQAEEIAQRKKEQRLKQKRKAERAARQAARERRHEALKARGAEEDEEEEQEARRKGKRRQRDSDGDQADQRDREQGAGKGKRRREAVKRRGSDGDDDAQDRPRRAVKLRDLEALEAERQRRSEERAAAAKPRDTDPRLQPLRIAVVEPLSMGNLILYNGRGSVVRVTTTGRRDTQGHADFMISSFSPGLVRLRGHPRQCVLFRAQWGRKSDGIDIQRVFLKGERTEEEINQLLVRLDRRGRALVDVGAELKLKNVPGGRPSAPDIRFDASYVEGCVGDS